MLQRSVRLMRRSEWIRPYVSIRGPEIGACGELPGESWTSWLTLTYREHAFERNQRAIHDLGRQFDTRPQSLQASLQLLERVQLHIRALAAVAILVRDEMKLFARRELFERIPDSALRHHDKFGSALLRAPIDDGRSGTDEIGHAQHLSGALRMGGY